MSIFLLARKSRQRKRLPFLLSGQWLIIIRLSSRKFRIEHATCGYFATSRTGDFAIRREHETLSRDLAVVNLRRYIDVVK